jgi:hypothetical protein
VTEPKLRESEAELTRAWQASRPVRHFVVDDLFDPACVQRVANAPSGLVNESTSP